MSNTERMSDLADTFHVLVGLPGVRPFNPVALDTHVAEMGCGYATKQAASFIVNLWSTRRPWKTGPFNVFAAMVAWDDGNLAAFQAWVARPWRP